MQTYKLSVSLFLSISRAQIVQSNVDSDNNSNSSSNSNSDDDNKSKDNAYAIENCCWQQQSRA